MVNMILSLYINMRLQFPRNVFFFQAEDGIRIFHVTGVQTCALPIWAAGRRAGRRRSARCRCARAAGGAGARGRSEERRVGKECRLRWLPDHKQKNNESNMMML